MNNTTEKLGLKVLEQAEEIKELHQQLAQRDAEVAKMVNLLTAITPLNTRDSEIPDDTILEHLISKGQASKLLEAIDDLKATAEAHDAKVREQAIREERERILTEFLMLFIKPDEFHTLMYSKKQHELFTERLLNNP